MSNYITPVMYIDSSTLNLNNSVLVQQTSTYSKSTVKTLENQSMGNNWRSSWFNSKGYWYNWSGNVFQATNGEINIAIASLKFGFLKVTNHGYQVINARFDGLRVDYQQYDNMSLYATAGSAKIYFGFDYTNGTRIYAKASAISIGGNIGPLGARVDFGSIGIICV